MRLSRAAMAGFLVGLGLRLGAVLGLVLVLVLVLFAVACRAPRAPAQVAPCSEGAVPLLGACVSPDVGDAWCGPAARMSSRGGCVFRECAGDEALDLDGACVPLGAVVRTGPPCPAGAALVVEGRRTACIPADAACPRGRSLQGSRCLAPAATATAAQIDTRHPVDVGLWAATVLGRSGGPGSPDTCRPLAQRPDLFGLTPGQALTVRLSLRIFVPDEDLSRAYAEIQTHPALPPAADALARQAISTSLAALRALGWHADLAGEGPRQTNKNEATAGVVDLEVTCDVKSF